MSDRSPEPHSVSLGDRCGLRLICVKRRAAARGLQTKQAKRSLKPGVRRPGGGNLPHQGDGWRVGVRGRGTTWVGGRRRKREVFRSSATSCCSFFSSGTQPFLLARRAFLHCRYVQPLARVLTTTGLKESWRVKDKREYDELKEAVDEFPLPLVRNVQDLRHLNHFTEIWARNGNIFIIIKHQGSFGGAEGASGYLKGSIPVVIHSYNIANMYRGCLFPYVVLTQPLGPQTRCTSALWCVFRRHVALESCWTHQQACQVQWWMPVVRSQHARLCHSTVMGNFTSAYSQINAAPAQRALLHQQQGALIVFSYKHWNMETKSEGWRALMGTLHLSNWPPSLVLANGILFLMIFDTGFISFSTCVCQRRPPGWWRRALDAQLVRRSGP